MVNLLHARVVFEHLNIEHANCRIVALSHCRKLLPVAMSPCRQQKSLLSFCHLSSVITLYFRVLVISISDCIGISIAYFVTSTA